MRTVVTSYIGGTFAVDGFLALAGRFYQRRFVIDVAAYDEPKSDQLRRILHTYNDEYLILMEDDFYLVRPVDWGTLDRVCQFCREHKVDRFSLQSKNVHSYTNWHETEHTVGECRVYKTVPEVVNAVSLEASVWKRSFLFSHLAIGWNDAEIETQMSAAVRHVPTKIFGLDQIVVHYRDAIRDGQQVIELHDNPLRLAGPSLALYPRGDRDSEVLIL